MRRSFFVSGLLLYAILTIVIRKDKYIESLIFITIGIGIGVLILNVKQRKD